MFYPSYDLFYNQYNICAGRILRRPLQQSGLGNEIIKEEGEPGPDEPSDEVKNQVKKRDGRCLCCGWTKRFEIDHIMPKHYKGSHEIENLQSLCKKCNMKKNENYIDFTATSFSKSLDALKKRKIDTSTIDLEMPPKALYELDVPSGTDAREPSEWERFLRGTINFFYKCGAVHKVTIGRRGDSFYHWLIELNAGNDPKWIKPYLRDLLNRISMTKQSNGYGAPNLISISAPNEPSVSFSFVE